MRQNRLPRFVQFAALSDPHLCSCLEPAIGVTSHGPVMPAEGNVRQLRVVVVADDYDAAVIFYRDRLGMPEVAACAEGGDDRVAILDAGRATLEIASTTHARTIDVAEADGLESPRVRLGFEVEDTSGLTDRLVQDGGAGAARGSRTDAVAVRELTSRRPRGPGDHVVSGDRGPGGAGAQREGFARDTDR